MNNMKILERIDDLFYDIAPHWLYCLCHNITNFRGHICRIKRFGQRLIRGWDDSDTWSLDDSFYKWLSPRLKRFTELNFCYPGDKRYPTFESWDNELQYRCWQLDKIIEYSYKEFDFPYLEYLPTDNQSKELYKRTESYQKSQAYLICKHDFMLWFGDNIHSLWW